MDYQTLPFQLKNVIKKGTCQAAKYPWATLSYHLNLLSHLNIITFLDLNKSATLQMFTTLIKNKFSEELCRFTSDIL